MISVTPACFQETGIGGAGRNSYYLKAVSFTDSNGGFI